jgi:hypothetical protein
MKQLLFFCFIIINLSYFKQLWKQIETIIYSNLLKNIMINLGIGMS